jgi:hypothetical protein
MEINSMLDLDREIDRLSTVGGGEELPRIVTIEIPSFELAFGTGSQETFLQMRSETGTWAILSDANASGKAEYFLYGEHHTEIPRRYLIPMATLRKALSQFLETGQRSTEVAWEPL